MNVKKLNYYLNYCNLLLYNYEKNKGKKINGNILIKSNIVVINRNIKEMIILDYLNFIKKNNINFKSNFDNIIFINNNFIIKKSTPNNIKRNITLIVINHKNYLYWINICQSRNYNLNIKSIFNQNNLNIFLDNVKNIKCDVIFISPSFFKLNYSK